MVALQIVNEYKRKLFHLLCLLYAAFYAFLPRSSCFIVMGILGIMIVSLEWARLNKPAFKSWVKEYFGDMTRAREEHQMTSAIWTWLGSLLTMIIFQKRNIVLAALGFMIFGDAAAAVVGKLWGRHRWPGRSDKSIEGTVAFAVAAACAGFLFLPPFPVVISALVAAALEASPLPIDDNLLIPLAAGFCLSVLRSF